MITARVLVSYGGHGVVKTATGIFPCRWRRGAGRPVCGDRIEIQMDRQQAVLQRIEPRSSEFKRGDTRGRAQIIAANVEQVVIVVAAEPQPSDFVVDRYLVAVETLGLSALLVMNKAELAASQEVERRMGLYRQLNVPLIRTSTKCNPPGTEELSQALSGRISILVGQSGVGKSSLINAVIPDREEQTGALSDATGKGRHTTTRTAWIEVPTGGAVVDSPGVWEYGLWTMAEHDIANAFTDFGPFLGHCRFRDCRHVHEPDCALRAAINSGELSEHRLKAYHNILKMQANNARA